LTYNFIIQKEAEEMSSKFALVIANTEYQDASFAKLTAPGKDAEEFAQILKAPELAAFDDVQVLLNEGEGKTRRSIAHFFAERKPADLLLLYFSGHGVRNEQGQLFLAANDTEISILEATGIPAEFITRAMNNSRSQRQLLILDCCNSGAFAHGSKSATGVGKSMGIATAFEGDGYGRVVLTATDATQFAWEGDKVIGNTQHSVFTHFLIEGLRGEADRDGDGRIHVDELYDYAYEQVVLHTPKQTPGKWSYKQQGDIVLRENLKPRDVKPSALPADLLELLSYPNFSARKAGIQELIILLDGKHLGLARSAEEKLRDIAATDASLDLRKIAADTLIAHGLLLEQPSSLPVTPPHTAIQRPQTPQPVSLPRSENLNPWRLLGLGAGGVAIISLLLWGGWRLFVWASPATEEPNVVFTAAALTIQAQLTTTQSSQQVKTKTPSPTTTSEIIVRHLLEKSGVTTYEPDLISSWEYSEDLTKWTFHLLSDIRSEDGNPLTAFTVRDALNTWLPVEAGVATVELVDDYTFVVYFSEPQQNESFFNDLSTIEFRTLK
jgi:caspase domain-containing protein/extracellular solute-binding protein (family 5)